MKIALYKGTDIMSRLIRLQTRSHYSHAALMHEDGSVCEATARPLPFGVVRGSATIGVRHPAGIEVDIFDIDAPYSVSTALAWVEDQLGLPYDFRSVLRFVTRKPADHNGKWFCSELVFAFFKVGGLSLLNGIHAHDVSPRDLSLSPYLRHVETRVT